MTKVLLCLWQDERGQNLTEYGLILGFGRSGGHFDDTELGERTQQGVQ
jgi:hypothetical protein